MKTCQLLRCADVPKVTVWAYQIVLQKLIASRTNRIVMPLRRLDKSDRIVIKFYYAAVSSSDIFGTAVSIALYWSSAPKLSRQSFFVRKIETVFRKFPMMTQLRSETPSTFLCQYHLICPDGDVRHNSAVALRYVLPYWQSVFCITI